MSNNFNFPVIEPVKTSDFPPIDLAASERWIAIKYATPNGLEVTTRLRESEVPHFLAGNLYRRG